MATWSELTQELDRWHETGANATFWWRDDDAADDTPQLDVLFKLAGAIPLALAVIPGLATRTLAESVAQRSSVVVLQHGWRHDNHAQAGNSEYPGSRSMEDVSQELAEGQRVLTGLFGSQAMPVFTPPWHAFDACFLPLLRRNSIIGISRRGPRAGPFARKGLLQANTHMVPVRWSDPPSFEDDGLYLAAAVEHLRGRRLGLHDPEEPTGLLTHHLVHNARCNDFIARFAEIVSTHRAATWLNAKVIFGPQAARGVP